MINRYSFGSITIDDKDYDRDLIIYPDRIDAGWIRKKGHEMGIDDLTEMLKMDPEVLIIGTGNPGYLEVSGEIRGIIESKGVSLYIYPTEEAVKVYNKMHQDKKTIAALHLTC